MIKVGDKFKTNEGYDVEVLDYVNANKVLISFSEPRKYEKFVIASKLREGKISNPYHTSLYGKGYLGEGNRKDFRQLWTNMLRRCYSSKDHKSKFYESVKVCDEWLNLTNFTEWVLSQKYEEGWELDKDILSNRDKVYSPDTCCFVPKEINTAMVLPRKSLAYTHMIGMYIDKRTGNYVARAKNGKMNSYIGVFKTEDDAYQAYKQSKETYIKQLAEKWKDVIDERVYQKLSNFTVEDWLKND